MSKWFLPLLLVLAACHQGPKEKKLKVQASSTPQAQMLQLIQPTLKQEGIDLEILIVDDYQIPNRALADKDIDANFFQHKLFLEEQIRQFHYPLCSLAEIHIEPMGLYPGKIQGTSPKRGSIIAIPNDPTNETRALFLLEQAGWIKLRKTKEFCQLTPLDVQENPYELKIRQVDAALLSRTLQEVEASVIPTNYALLAGLDPRKEALVLENSSSQYVNIIAVRCEDLHREDLQKLKQAMQSQKIKDYLLSTYQGSIIPAF